MVVVAVAVVHLSNMDDKRLLLLLLLPQKNNKEHKQTEGQRKRNRKTVAVENLATAVAV